MTTSMEDIRKLQNSLVRLPPIFSSPSLSHRVCEKTSYKPKDSSFASERLHRDDFRKLFDHINGGIFRYSEDRQWLNPHFEKMLSDNAIFLSTVSRAYRKNNNLLYKYAVRPLVSYFRPWHLKTGMGSSLSSEIQSIEGAKYLWEKEHLEQALNSSEDLFRFQINSIC